MSLTHPPRSLTRAVLASALCACTTTNHTPAWVREGSGAFRRNPLVLQGVAQSTTEESAHAAAQQALAGLVDSFAGTCGDSAAQARELLERAIDPPKIWKSSDGKIFALARIPLDADLVDRVVSLKSLCTTTTKTVDRANTRSFADLEDPEWISWTPRIAPRDTRPHLIAVGVSSLTHPDLRRSQAENRARAEIAALLDPLLDRATGAPCPDCEVVPPMIGLARALRPNVLARARAVEEHTTGDTQYVLVTLDILSAVDQSLENILDHPKQLRDRIRRNIVDALDAVQLPTR